MPMAFAAEISVFHWFSSKESVFATLTYVQHNEIVKGKTYTYHKMSEDSLAPC